RVARQAEDRHARAVVAPEDAEALRLAGLYRHGRERDVAERGENLLDDVVRTGTDAAGGDQRVDRAEVVLQQAAELGRVVTDEPERDGSSAEHVDEPEQQHIVRLRDLARAEWRAGRDELVA